MLQKTPPDARHCRRSAFESRCYASTAEDGSARDYWRGMERRWLLLAESCDSLEETQTFLASLRIQGAPRPRAEILRAHGGAARGRAAASARLKRQHT